MDIIEETFNNNILFIGGGAIATAMGNILSKKPMLNVCLLSIETKVVESINNCHINKKYFPSFTLEKSLRASTDFGMLQKKSIVFIAIPSVKTVDFVSSQNIHPESILVNLAKGFGNGEKTIIECLSSISQNPLASLKGPSFAREIINNQPTSFTLGSNRPELYPLFQSLFSNINIHIDYSSDTLGVEIISIIKNIYAIVIGIVDAQFESSNLKFLVFTKALNEMRRLLLLFGGEKETIFNYCGIGDFALTALNDLSRNRTLGLLIGKGFFTDNISEKVVLEGRIAVNVFHNKLTKIDPELNDFPILEELYKVFNEDYDISGFVGNMLKE
jgi:glycerol-3-phosphate dehydrogenase (NAD(P)+)